MSVDTPIAIMSRFEGRARSDFDERLRQVSRRMLGYLTRVPAGGDVFDVREVTGMLVTMDAGERYSLLHRVVPNTDGPATLEGMEALCSFVGNYLLDDSVCVVVSEPRPEDPDEDPWFMTTLATLKADPDNSGKDEDELRRVASARVDARGRPSVLVPGVTGDGTPARAPDVLRAIVHNAALVATRQDAAPEDGPAFAYP